MLLCACSCLCGCGYCAMPKMHAFKSLFLTILINGIAYELFTGTNGFKDSKGKKIVPLP